MKKLALLGFALLSSQSFAVDNHCGRITNIHGIDQTIYLTLAYKGGITKVSLGNKDFLPLAAAALSNKSKVCFNEDYLDVRSITELNVTNH